MTAVEASRKTLDAAFLEEVIDRLGPVAVMVAVRDADDTIVDFRYLLVNEAFARTLGEPAEVLVGARLLELYPSHLDLGLFDAYCQVVDTGEPYVSELPWFDERNLRAFLEVQVTPFQDGYLMTGRDITEAKMAEQVTRIFDSSQDGIISTDDLGVITAWNAGAEELYGYSESEALGCHISLCAPDTVGQEQSELIQRVMSGEAPAPFEAERCHRDGTPRRVEIAAAPILDGAGRPIGVSLVHRDLSDRPEAFDVAPVDGDPEAVVPSLTSPWEHGVTVVAGPRSRPPEVEVWCRFSHRWMSGFQVLGVNPDGTVRVRRPTGGVLPEALTPDMVRPVSGWTGSNWAG